MTTALVLAGDRGEGDPFAKDEEKTLKAFIDILGSSMLDRVIKTLNACDRIQHIILCLPESVDLHHEAPFTASLIEEGKLSRISQENSPVESVSAAYKILHGNPELLITTADHPLLTPEMLETIITKAQNGVSVGLTPLQTIIDAYPESMRTGLKFADGHYSGTNLFYLKGQDSEKILNYWQNLQNLRKKPISMARQIGFGILFAYVMGTLTLKKTLEAISKKSGVNIQPIFINDPHAGIDVDKKEDLDLVRKILSKKE